MKSSIINDRKKRVNNENSRPIPRRAEKSSVILTQEDVKTYGDRCPPGFRKIKLLGKGGCALVWLAIDNQTSQQVAVKQASKHHGPGAIESCKREIFFGNLLKDIQHPAIQNTSRLLSFKSEKNDLWAMFELGGSSLGKCLFQMKGEFIKSERIYNIEHLPMYTNIVENPEILKSILTDILNVLDLFCQLNIVHSDLKPDNILVEERNLEVKLIDLGSAFSFIGNGSITTATPEYMPPEALAIAHSPGDHIQTLAGISQPWSFDIWSLGMILMEILTGVPLWMSLKSRVVRMGRSVSCKGLLGASGRDPEMILRLEEQVTRDVLVTFRKYGAFEVSHEFLDLLERMLCWDPLMRISPQEALDHPFLAEL